MGEPLEPRDAQAAEIIDRLADEYPDADIGLNFSTRLELLIAVILSAQCTDERVNRVTDDLFDKYPDAAAFADADQEDLAADLSSVTYYNNKARYIRSACQDILTEHDGKVPDDMGALTDLSGVGRKTANVVLQHGHDTVEGIVVDTHVQRLSRRLGLAEAKRPEAIERDLMSIVPQEAWREYTHYLIAHGRAVCTARSPDCSDCVLNDLCPSSKTDSRIDLATGEEW